MKFLTIHLILLLSISWGMDINTTIEKGDVQTYESILANLTKNPQKNDEKDLQKALLYKLINLSKNSQLPPVKMIEPKDMESFAGLISQYGNWALMREAAKKSLVVLEQKLKTIDEQLQEIDKNDPKALTLQLQHAFYQKGKALYNRKIARLNRWMNQAITEIVTATKKLSFDDNSLRKNLDKIDKKIQKNQRKREKLDIEKERLNLLGRIEDVKKISKRQQILTNRYKDLLNKKLQLLFLRFAAAIHDKRIEEAFTLHRQIVELASKEYSSEIVEEITTLLKTMERQILGRAASIEGATFEQIERLASMLWKQANAPLFTIGETSISIFKLVIAFIIFLMGFFVGSFYKKTIRRLTFESETITLSTQTLLANIGYYLIVIVAFFIALNILGINLSSIALVAGALSVGIGFGLQNIVSNFVSGLILMFERSIKIGDYVELDENLRGHVSDIRMRSTTITTNDNIDVIVPNQDLIQNRVINWTMNDRIRRFRIPFGVAYGTDAHRVIDVILKAIETSGFNDIYSDYHRKTRVVMTGMGDSSVDFELFVWLRGGEILYPRRTRSRFLILIYDALYEAGIEIPFPQRDIHLRSIDAPISLSIRKEG